MRPDKYKRNYFTKHLVMAREDKFLTQEQAAQLLNISQSKLSKIENGNLTVDVYLLYEIVRVYSKPFHYFFPPLILDSVNDDEI